MAQVPASDSRCGGHVAGGGAHRARGGMEQVQSFHMETDQLLVLN